jgi:hypothetical protein
MYICSEVVLSTEDSFERDEKQNLYFIDCIDCK